MPCYCDTPNSKDQAEIERRCKVGMYFAVQGLMSKKQIKKANEFNIGQFPGEDVNQALCNICKLMTENQLKKVSAYYYEIKWPHKTLYDWYVTHVADDKEHNK